MIASIHTYG